MNIKELKIKLKNYSKEDIIITEHARVRAIVRNIDIEEVKENILNPEKLVYVETEKAERKEEEKYGCYFAYSENYCHKYIIVLNRNLIIVTIISINRNWQRMIKI